MFSQPKNPPTSKQEFAYRSIIAFPMYFPVLPWDFQKHTSATHRLVEMKHVVRIINPRLVKLESHAVSPLLRNEISRYLLNKCSTRGLDLRSWFRRCAWKCVLYRTKWTSRRKIAVIVYYYTRESEREREKESLSTIKWQRTKRVFFTWLIATTTTTMDDDDDVCRVRRDTIPRFVT